MEHRRNFPFRIGPIVFITFFGLSLHLNAQKKPDLFKIFNSKGKEVSWKKLVNTSRTSDLVFFGEYHDDPIIHYLQLQLLKELSKTVRNLALGLEMIEWTDADLLEKYVSHTIDEHTFLKNAKSLWTNYSTDYAPMVKWAVDNKIVVFGSNIPRAWASGVYKYGFTYLDTIQSELKSKLPPLPIPFEPDLPGYKKMLEMVPGHGGENFPKAQAIKDASMAWTIAKKLADGHRVLHLNGAYHTLNFEGIIWYIQQYTSNVKIISITTVRQNQIQKLEKEHRGKADFIIVVPSDMIRTH